MNLNAISVDVEDYFQVSAFANNVKRDDWENIESRVENNTHNLLDLFESRAVKCTFFVLGWVAERNQKLIKDISDRGHEVACHGYSHRLIYEQSPEEFRQETIRAKLLLEDIVQKEVIGYRAASYSITKKSLWALDVLVEAGFKYDSSIFPVRHDRYGIPGAKSVPDVLKTPSGNTIVEFPLTTLNLFGYKLPMAGGGYFRLYPYLLTKMGLRYVSQVEGKPTIFYLHPWEVDPGQPKIAASWLSKFRHYNNLDKCENRLNKLISDFEFTTVIDVLEKLNLVSKK